MDLSEDSMTYVRLESIIAHEKGSSDDTVLGVVSCYDSIHGYGWVTWMDLNRDNRGSVRTSIEAEIETREMVRFRIVLV